MHVDAPLLSRLKLPRSLPYFLLGLLLYPGFLSVQYDLNGIAEALAIERGGAQLFHQNHLLYRPAIWLVYRGLQGFGYTGQSLGLAQALTAIMGALGVALFYTWIRSLVKTQTIAVIATIGFATSWAYWAFSTDVYYIVPAATFVIGAILILTKVLYKSGHHVPIGQIILMAGLSSLAILLWQANIFFPPTVLLGMAVKYRGNRQNLATAILVYGVTLAILVGGVYLLASLSVLQDSWTPVTFLDWLLRYGGGYLPSWGRWDVARVVDAFRSFLSSFIPIRAGLGLSDLTEGRFPLEKAPCLASLVALAFLFLLPASSVWISRRRLASLMPCIAYCGIGFLFYMPFIVWWDPFEAKWFVIPCIAVWAIIALAWETVADRLPRTGIFAGLIFVIALANFTATIWPNRTNENVALTWAECIASQMGEGDVLITTDWIWGGYLEYFYQKNVFSLLGTSAQVGKDETLTQLQAYLDIIHERNSKAYVVNIDSYWPEHRVWLTEQFGFTAQDFERFQGSPAFVCDRFQFVEVNRIITPTFSP